MKNTNRLLCAGAALAMGASLVTGLYAQNTEAVRDHDKNNNANGHLQGSSTASSDQAHMIGRVNKASNLIGMDVRNTQNEKLGDIKDVVLDLHSGKIGYVVLSVGGFLGLGDKYIAVPPSAFSASADENTLVLNADKAKLQNAKGFSKNDWPEMNEATWTGNSAYWTTENNTAQGTVAGASTTTGRGTAAGNANSTTFRGRIVSVNPQANTFTVQGLSGTREFRLSNDATLTLKEDRNPHLIDFKAGYPVVVGYHEENGSYVAHTLTRADTPEVR